MTPLLLEADGETWRYAAWVAIDFRLVLFAGLLAALTAAGVAALLVKSRRLSDYLAVWLLGFTSVFAMTVLLMNEVAQHPVFVVESLFPFP